MEARHFEESAQFWGRFHIYINTTASAVVTIPQTQSEMELIAPWILPISKAFIVPMAWLQAPMATPSATGSVILKCLARKGARTAPSIPVMTTAAAVMPGIPPPLSEIPSAMAVVTLLGSMDAEKMELVPKRWQRATAAAMLTRLPKAQPMRMGRKCSCKIAFYR